MNTLFHTAPIAGETWVRIGLVAVFSLVAIEVEKKLRFAGRRGEVAIPE
jgi:hypothetical protein